MKTQIHSIGWPTLALGVLAGIIALADLLVGDSEFFAAGILGGTALGVLAVWALLQAWDRSNGLAWKDAYAAMASDPKARAVYHAGRLIAVCLVIGCSPASPRGLSDTRFDAAISKAAERYLPTGPHWIGYKAQLWQESRLDPAAISPLGVCGLAQFMPGTWSCREPGPTRSTISILRQPPVRITRSLLDRHRLAEASYNAGMGNILKSQRRCDNAAAYAAIIACLPETAGHRHRETWTYVERIERWTERLRQSGIRSCRSPACPASRSARCSNGAPSRAGTARTAGSRERR